MPHTPEPWELQFYTLDRIYIRKPEAGGRSIPIAMVVDNGDLSPGELESNAELLLRSPRLLLFLSQCCFFTPIQEAMARCAMPSAGNFGRTVGDYAGELLAELKKAGIL